MIPATSHPHGHSPMSGILRCPQSALIQMFTHQGVLPHPDIQTTQLHKSLSNIILYLGTGTHGTTQHYIASKTHPPLSLHCALGSKPCGDMPSNNEKSQARNDAFHSFLSSRLRSAQLTPPRSSVYQEWHSCEQPRNTHQLPKLNESQQH